jgi:hypothetical protein
MARRPRGLKDILAMAQLAQTTDPSAPFQPDQFFLSRTDGAGVVRDFSGRLLRRCVISTVGRWDHQYGAMHFDETFAFDDGHLDTLNWTFSHDAQGRLVATEPSVTTKVRGWTEGPDYRLRFKRPGEPPLSGFDVTYDVRFTALEPTVVLKVTRLKLFGVTLGALTAYHRQIEPDSGSAGPER